MHRPVCNFQTNKFCCRRQRTPLMQMLMHIGIDDAKRTAVRLTRTGVTTGLGSIFHRIPKPARRCSAMYLTTPDKSEKYAAG